MDRIVTPDEAALLFHGTDSKSKANVIRRQCADGTIKNCEKVGVKWYINATREWPHLFGEVEPPDPFAGAAAPKRPPITVDTTVGELMALLLGEMTTPAA